MFFFTWPIPWSLTVGRWQKVRFYINKSNRLQSTFPGRVLHAHDFRDAREFAGKKILIVGARKSAEDIAMQCVKFGSGEVVCTYRHRWDQSKIMQPYWTCVKRDLICQIKTKWGALELREVRLHHTRPVWPVRKRLFWSKATLFVWIKTTYQPTRIGQVWCNLTSHCSRTPWTKWSIFSQLSVFAAPKYGPVQL